MDRDPFEVPRRSLVGRDLLVKSKKRMLCRDDPPIVADHLAVLAFARPVRAPVEVCCRNRVIDLVLRARATNRNERLRLAVPVLFDRVPDGVAVSHPPPDATNIGTTAVDVLDRSLHVDEIFTL